MGGRHPAVRAALPAVAVPLLLFGALTALLAAHGWGPFPLESSLHRWAVDHRPAAAVHIVGVVTDLGSGAPPYLAAAAAGLLLVRRTPRPRRPLLAACAPVVALALGQLIRNLLMRAFARPRPPMADWVAASPSGYSYPSGHAFTAAAAAGLLAWALLRGPRRAWTVPAVAALGTAAVAVGLSRIYLGVHWPLDVLGGWLLACLWLALTLPLIGSAARRPPAGSPGTPPRSEAGSEP
ncbi:phosphatase PAP2 family protein [Kitasatospora sp. NPDC057015]|uniref:phosphatase PAP2 family protein n=1 Tax=Kitasatospora sp. NPDC057015 TaxID=3346001 RepID=UPI003632A137